ncbi:fimbrial biogenesis chaperone [Acinetobacter larvae]|uniref:Fimbrial chaperone protein n=1 Tax=Acinetobacter larvae TaxID=1789224 RepID=A0A1B2M2S6_9GAMM|nr:fimbria/pilus periplasmic chaperone [Acinetobacter larvae]AOA59492.1 fimbrial chaperone protein [Acinetobacter larvae]
MLRTSLLSLAVLLSQSLYAGVTIDGTRVIFPSNAKSVSVQLRNGLNTPALVQTWIDDGDVNRIPAADQIPFVLTPPLSRVEPNKGQIIRIIPTGSPSLAQDRESLFWFNMLDIPPNDPQYIGKNLLTFNVRTRIKLFYRPATLKMSTKTAYRSIKATYNGASQEVTLNNPTPYFITITQMDFKSASKNTNYKQAVMLEPFSQQTVEKLIVNFLPEKLSYQIMNDLGGIQSFETQFD